MLNHHPHQNDLLILDSGDPNRRSKLKNKHVVIDLIDDDDDYGENSEDCVLLKNEVNLSSRGNHQKSPICIKENFENESKSNIKSRNIASDNDDEVRVIDVMPPCSRKKRRNGLGYFSSIEKGESSRSKREGNDGGFIVMTDEAVIEPPVLEVTTFMCEICSDSKPQEAAFWIKGCSHSYCSDCTKTYVASKLQDGVSSINCPVPKCYGTLDPEYCREILPFKVFVKWGKMLCESAIHGSKKFYCPFKDCSALLVDDGVEKVTSSECPCCNRLFCAQCKVAWHAGIGCAEYKSLRKGERNREDIMLVELANKKKWKRCPNCKYYIEKSYGCSNMRCRCGTCFLYY